jgi:hypothetical protein
MLEALLARLRAPPALLARAVVVFLVFGMGMNSVGKALRIAEFANWWQVVTCYLLYVLPLALLVRELPVARQYAWSVLAFCPLELVAYALGTSKAYPDNIIDRVLGERNFTLAMVLICGLVPVVGNLILRKLEGAPEVAPPG